MGRSSWCLWLMVVLAAVAGCAPASAIRIERVPLSKPRVPDPSQSIRKLAQEALKQGQLLGEHEQPGSANSKHDVVSKTLDGLGQVLHRMYDQVQSDEEVFRKFKKKLLENELSKASTEVDWPTIKALVKAEVNTGRARIQQMISRFKLQVLDIVQKGLDTLRADLRATVVSAFAAADHGNTPALDGILGAFATGPSDKMKKEQELEDRIAHLEAKRASTAGGLSSADRQALKAARDQLEQGRDSVDWQDITALTDSLVHRIPVNDKAREEIKAFVAQKVNQSNSDRAPQHQLLENHTGLEDYGETALQALRDLQAALKGRLSQRDLRSEVSKRLEEVTRQYVQKPSPAGRQAMKELRTSITAALEGLEDAAKQDRQRILGLNGTKAGSTNTSIDAKSNEPTTHIKAAEHRFRQLQHKNTAAPVTPAAAALSAARAVTGQAAEVVAASARMNRMHRLLTNTANKVARSVPNAMMPPSPAATAPSFVDTARATPALRLKRVLQ